jgi:hypothetical protein
MGDQLPQFLGNPGSTAAPSGAPAPVETKAGAVPANGSFYFDNHEDIGPAGPKAAERGPEQPVTGVQGWPRSLALEDGDLLAESQNFEGSIGSCAKQSAHGSQEADKELKHELTVLTWRIVMSIGVLDIAQLIDFAFRRGIVYAQVSGLATCAASFRAFRPSRLAISARFSELLPNRNIRLTCDRSLPLDAQAFRP